LVAETKAPKWQFKTDGIIQVSEDEARPLLGIGFRRVEFD